ncbi:head-tail connector protein, partial [Prochlorococcus sp. ALOHA_ZT_50]|uniref:head-tail connector protein n=1 Tax=Prochlorococcus sp. ALOHA_ZT_50 TaxID=2919303 RepID=UPI0025808454
MLEKILEKKCDLIVSLEDVKSNLVISEDEDVIDSDELLKTRILIAQSLCEQYTNKPLTKTKYAVRYDLPYNNQDSYLSFSDPGNIFKNIRLPYRPLISVESMTSVRYNGETFPVDVSDYVVDTELDIVYFNNYPTRGEMLKIIFLAGYERVSDVPASY